MTSPGLEAERAVLGAVLLDPASWRLVRAVVAANDFEHPGHRDVYEACAALEARSAPIDVVTLGDELKARGAKLALFGSGFLVELAQSVPTAANVQHYANIVVRDAAKRAIALEASKLTAAPEDAQTVLAELQRLLLQATVGKRRPTVDVAEILGDVVEAVKERQHKQRARVTTTLPGLDYLTNGLDRGSLTVIGARTSLGKTAFACQIALANARRKVWVLFFSLEMRPQELVERFLAHVGQVPSNAIRTGHLTAEQWRQLQAAGAALARDKGRFRISTARKLSDIVAEIRCFRVEHPEDDLLVVVDYIQLTAGTAKLSREQQVAEITRELKACSQEADLPIVAPAQLNRGPEADDREPQISDLRESGAIEQDADNIWLLHRRRSAGATDVYVKVAKQRNGSIGEVAGEWDGATYTITERGERPHWADAH